MATPKSGRQGGVAGKLVADVSAAMQCGSNRSYAAAMEPPQHPHRISGMLPNHICSILAAPRAFLQHQDVPKGRHLWLLQLPWPVITSTAPQYV